MMLAPASVAGRLTDWLREVSFHYYYRRKPRETTIMASGQLLTSSVVDNLSSILTPNGLIIAMEEPQDGRSHHVAIVLEMCRLLGTVRMLDIRQTAGIHAHLNLAVHHVLVESEVRLGGEHAVADIDALDRGVLAGPPDVYLGPWVQ